MKPCGTTNTTKLLICSQCLERGMGAPFSAVLNGDLRADVQCFAHPDQSHGTINARDGIVMFPPGSLIGRQKLDNGLMERVLRSAYLNTYLPVATHRQIARGSEVALAIGLSVYGIGAHIHVQLCGV